MRVWLVKTGEPLPITGNERLLRMGIIAEVLHRRNHEVIWWTSTFDHATRKQRYPESQDITIARGYRVKMLYSPGYRKSISPQRLWDHYVLGRAFREAILEQPRPDIILCALPTLELSAAAVEFGVRNRVPVILDLRDMWPDIFLEVIPGPIRALGRTVLRPWFKMVKEACRGASALIGITEDFVEWGLGYAGRAKSALDRVFPLAYRRIVPSNEAVRKAVEFWSRMGVDSRKDERLIFCFFGTMGHQLDMETVVRTARQLQDHNVQFVLCGSGDNLEYYRRLAKDCNNVVLPGWVGAVEIWTLMQMSCAGLAPYKSSYSFVRSIPNKVAEYLSAGLPIITSLEGRLKDVIRDYSCGYWYPNGNSDALTSIILELFTNRVELRAARNNAKRVYDSMFDADKVYGQLADYLESIVQTKPARNVLT